MIHVLLFIGLVGLPAQPAQDIGFSGVWERDIERSDDPQEKMQAAMEQMREQTGQRGGGGGRPGGGGGRGERGGGGRPGGGGGRGERGGGGRPGGGGGRGERGGGGRPGGGGGRGERGGGGRPGGGGGRGERGGGGRPGGGGGRGERGGGGGRPDVGNIPDELTVELTGEEFQVDDGERLRIYYLDGKKHKRETQNGMKLETIAELKGSAILIEEKMERGKIDRKFELSPDGATMIMTLTVKFGRMKDPVVIRTVYEMAGAAD